MKLIKTSIILIILCFSPQLVFSQLDIGKTKSQIKSNYSVAPCEEAERTLTFCSTDGSMIGYVFSNNRCESIQFLTPNSSKYKADIELEKAINKFAKENNQTPMTRGGGTSFTQGNGIGITFSVAEFKGTYYVRQIYQKY